jgi:hypothetical protein
MTSQAMFIAELVLFDVAAVIWAAWEFWAARPGGDTKEEASARTADPSPEGARHPEG